MTVAFDESAYLFPLVKRHIVHNQDGIRDVPLSKHWKQLLKKRTEELPVEGSCLCRVVEYLLTVHGAADGDVPRPQSWRNLHGSSPSQRPPLSCSHRDTESNFIDEVDLGLRNLCKQLQEGLSVLPSCFNRCCVVAAHWLEMNSLDGVVERLEYSADRGGGDGNAKRSQALLLESWKSDTAVVVYPASDSCLLVFSELVSLDAAALLCLDASFFGELVDDGVDGRSFHTHDVGDH